MYSFQLEIVERSVSLRSRPIGITLYMVDEAIRGVVPPTEWSYPEHRRWFDRFVLRLHARFLRFLSQEQRDTIVDLSGKPLAELYSFHLDAQPPYKPERYLPDPDRNAMRYLRRAYGIGAVREVCSRVKENVLMDPSETVCYSVGGTLRYLESIW